HFEKPRARNPKSGPSSEEQGEVKLQEWLKPRALRPGDTIAFVAPASPIEKDPVLSYAKQLEEAGFRVVLPKRLDRAERFLAGSVTLPVARGQRFRLCRHLVPPHSLGREVQERRGRLHD